MYFLSNDLELSVSGCGLQGLSILPELGSGAVFEPPVPLISQPTAAVVWSLPEGFTKLCVQVIVSPTLLPVLATDVDGDIYQYCQAVAQ